MFVHPRLVHPRRLLRTFVTGLLAVLPLAGTALLFLWILGLLYDWVGPSSLLGRLIIVPIGLGVAGSEFIGYLLGLAIMAGMIFGLGLLVERGLQRGMGAMVNALVGRIPIVRNVYETISKFVSLVSKRDDARLRTMRPVWCHFGGPGGAAVLGLLSTPEPITLDDGRMYYAVLVPTAPIPVGGGLLYVPQDWVRAADVGMEALTSIYVSMGVTSPQHLDKRAAGGGAVAQR